MQHRELLERGAILSVTEGQIRTRPLSEKAKGTLGTRVTNQAFLVLEDGSLCCGLA